MPLYRIVKWSPVLPAQRTPAIEQDFASLALAEQMKAQLEKEMPYRCFAVEEVETPADRKARTPTSHSTTKKSPPP